MFFTDQAFFLFLPVVVLLYWLVPFTLQNVLLLGASYLFYMWRVPWTGWILFGISTLVYISGLLLSSYPHQKRPIVAITALIALGVLGWFKYSLFIATNIQAIIPSFSFTYHVFLPAGISFFTFQGLAYVVDVARGEFPAERHFGRFLLFKSFFPQLVAGPIERAHNLMTQVDTPRVFRWENVVRGMDLFLLGYLKKCVVADNIAVYVNMIFDLKEASPVLLFVGGVGFAIQILADFSAYTDIARGCARFLGFELMENFRHPYLAKDPSDFWRRWHISLSNCIRDYLYIPLGGSRVSLPRWIFNMLIVWFLCGLWHGAGWNFVAWGLYWGGILILYRFLPDLGNSIGAALWRHTVMLFLIVCGWILFRIPSLSYLGEYFSSHAINLTGRQLPGTLLLLLYFFLYATPLFIALVGKLFIVPKAEKGSLLGPLRVLCYGVTLLLLLTFASESGEDFYYFQF